MLIGFMEHTFQKFRCVSQVLIVRGMLFSELMPFCFCAGYDDLNVWNDYRYMNHDGVDMHSVSDTSSLVLVKTYLLESKAQAVSMLWVFESMLMLSRVCCFCYLT